jgi:hypothetical protein
MAAAAGAGHHGPPPDNSDIHFLEREALVGLLAGEAKARTVVIDVRDEARGAAGESVRRWECGGALRAHGVCLCRLTAGFLPPLHTAPRTARTPFSHIAPPCTPQKTITKQ